MTRLAALTLIAISNAVAQLPSMAASADGAIFDFASRWALRTEPLGINGIRVFRYGLTPELRSFEAVPNTLAIYPLLSADGATQGVYTITQCFGRPCSVARPADAMRIERNGQQILLTGNELRISRNGRYVFDSGFPSLHPGPYLIDLDSNQRIRLPNVLTRHIRNTIADDGTLLSTEPGLYPGIGDPATYGEIHLTRLDQSPITLLKGIQVRIATIAPNGRTVFAITDRLLAIDTQSLERTVLLEPGSSIKSISPNHDGSRLLVSRDDELLVWDRNAGWRSLLTHDEGFAESQLTDDGLIVFAITRSGRYLRIDAATGAVEQLYAPVPSVLSRRTFGTYPGSLIRLGSNALLPDTTFTFDNQRIPIIKLDPSFVDLQIPWETQVRTGILEATREDSPFAMRIGITLAERPIPWIFTQDQSSLIVAAQADFGSLVTPANPAPAGSLIHFYVTGLGPLDQPLATGMRGPSSPPARPLAPISCFIHPNTSNLPILALRLPSVIYAPNLIGVYQVDAELPASWPAGLSTIACRGDGFEGSIASIPIR